MATNATNLPAIPNINVAPLDQRTGFWAPDWYKYLLAWDRINSQALPAVDISGKQTLFIPAGAMKPRATNGPTNANTETATNKVQIAGLDFDASTNQFAQFFVAMPKSWDKGTVTAVFYWEHPATSTNFGVVWGIQAVAMPDASAIDVAFGTAQEVTDTGGTTGDLYKSPETAAMTIAGTLSADVFTCFQVYRNAAAAADTLAVNARLLGVRILYSTDANNDT